MVKSLKTSRKTCYVILALSLVWQISCSKAESTSAGTTYYADWITGDDSQGGTCPDTAWKSLEKVNSTTFKPGDAILFKADGFWVGQLWPKGSGAEGKAIKVGMYGQGEKPIIAGQGKVEATVKLYNQEYWEISDLEITNFKTGDETYKRGVYIAAEDYGTVHHIHLKNLDIHSVNGTSKIRWIKKKTKGKKRDYSKYYGGIFFGAFGEEKKSNFDDFLIEGCKISEVYQLGITSQSSWRRRTLDDNKDWFPNTNVVVRNNWIERSSSNGCVIRCAKDAVIEHNVFKQCSMLASGNAMYPFNCDDAIVQYNESYMTVFNPKDVDAAGFDSDYQCKRSIFQYNYSHDNDYGFIAICNNGKDKFYKGGFNDGTIIRYNISQNDNGPIFRFSGPTTNTLIYNNTIYAGAKMYNPRHVTDNGVPKISWHKDWGGYAIDTTYFNNIIYNMSKEAQYDFGESTNTKWDYNVFYGEHPETEPNDPHKITDDPMLVNSGGGGIGINSVDGYKLEPNSPCIDSGMVIENNGGKDYFGNPLYKGKPDRGAHERQ